MNSCMYEARNWLRIGPQAGDNERSHDEEVKRFRDDTMQLQAVYMSIGTPVSYSLKSWELELLVWFGCFSSTVLGRTTVGCFTNMDFLLGLWTSSLETQPLYKFSGYPSTLQVSLVAEVRPKVVGCASKASQDQTYLGGLSCRMCMVSIMKMKKYTVVVIVAAEIAGVALVVVVVCCGVLGPRWVKDFRILICMFPSHGIQFIWLAAYTDILWFHEPSNHPSSQSFLWPCLRSCRGYPATHQCPVQPLHDS